MRTILGVIVGLTTIFGGIFLLNKVFIFILSIGIVQQILGLHSVVESVAIFILTLSVYGGPYAVATILSGTVSQNTVAPVVTSSVYIVTCLYYAYYFISVMPYAPMIAATIICALNACYQIVLYVKVTKAELPQT